MWSDMRKLLDERRDLEAAKEETYQITKDLGEKLLTMITAHNVQARYQKNPYESIAVRQRLQANIQQSMYVTSLCNISFSRNIMENVGGREKGVMAGKDVCAGVESRFSFAVKCFTTFYKKLLKHFLAAHPKKFVVFK